LGEEDSRLYSAALLKIVFFRLFFCCDAAFAVSEQRFFTQEELCNIDVGEVRLNIAYFTMPRKSSWVKKRCSETAKADIDFASLSDLDSHQGISLAFQAIFRCSLKDSILLRFHWRKMAWDTIEISRLHRGSVVH
jgi:hypothetical protein